jgi:hypothetical protein
MSKGSKPRPIEVSQEKYESNWDRIFSKKPRVEIVEEESPFKTPEEERRIAEMASIQEPS